MTTEALHTAPPDTQHELEEEKEIRLPNGPHFIDRINLAGQRRATDFKVWAGTLTSRFWGNRAASHAAEISTRIKVLKDDELRRMKQGRRDALASQREIRSGTSVLSRVVRQTRMGGWIEGKRLLRYKREEQYYSGEIEKINSAIAKKTTQLETAQATKATYDGLISKKAKELNEPLRQKQIAIELSLQHINSKITELENDTANYAAIEVNARTEAAAIEHRLRTEDLDPATESACEAKYDKHQDDIVNAVSILKEKRKLLDKAYRVRNGFEAQHRAITGTTQGLDAKYSRTISEVARPSISERTKEALAAARAIAPEIVPASTETDPALTEPEPEPTPRPKRPRTETTYDPTLRTPDLSHAFADNYTEPTTPTNREFKPLLTRLGEAAARWVLKLLGLGRWLEKNKTEPAAPNEKMMERIVARNSPQARPVDDISEIVSRNTPRHAPSAPAVDSLNTQATLSATQPESNTPPRLSWENIKGQQVSNKAFISLINKIAPGLNLTTMKDLVEKYDPDSRHTTLISNNTSDDHTSTLADLTSFLDLLTYKRDADRSVSETDLGRQLRELGVDRSKLRDLFTEAINRRDNAPDNGTI